MLDDLPGVADNAKKILFDMRCTTVIDDCNVHLRDVLNLLEDEMHSFRLSSIEANDLDKLYDTFYYYGKKEQLIEFLLDQMTNAINFKQADKDFLIYSWLVEKLTEEQICSRELMKIPNTIGITTLIHLLMSSLLIIKKQMELI